MKTRQSLSHTDLDPIDGRILMELQDHCKMPLARIGEKVGLSPQAVVERIKKLEDSGVIVGYTAVLNSRCLGLDVAAFIGVSIADATAIADFHTKLVELGDVLECHHVTGGYTFLLKVKTRNTSALESLISRVRCIEGVARTETMVVLSTHAEKTRLTVVPDPPAGRRGRRGADRAVAHG